MLCTFAHLEEEKLADLKSLEKKLGKIILAYSCRDVDAAPLKEDEISQIKQVEKRMNVSLVAVK